MTTSVRDSGPFEKVIGFSVTHAELEAAKTKTARRLSHELKIRGFRPGKAPRPIVEATVGADRLKSEAIDDLLPEKLASVLDEHEINPALTPELSDLNETLEGLDVEVTVTLWPTLPQPPAYQGRTVTVEPVEVSEDEIDGQIERVRDQFAQLETVERGATRGDYVSIDLSATAGGVEVPEASATQLLYEVGSGRFLDGIDEAIEGAGAGESRSFDSELPQGFGELAGRPVTFSVTVTEVRAKVLPAVDDEWVSDITEFETVAEFRQDLAERMAQVKKAAVARRFQEQALDQLVDETDLELPEGLIRSEMDEVLHRFVHRLETEGVTLDDYFQVAGIEQDMFVEDLRQQAIRSIKTRLVLEAVGNAAGVQVTTQEVAAVIEGLARRSERPDEFRKAFLASGRSLSLAGDILRNKALELIVAGASAVDASGNPVDLTIEDFDDLAEGDLAEGEVGRETSEEIEAEIVEAEVVEGEIPSGVVLPASVETSEEE